MSVGLRYRIVAAAVFVLLAAWHTAHPLTAQGPDACEASVRRAYAALGSSCNDLQRNDACVSSGSTIAKDAAGTVTRYENAGELFSTEPLTAISTESMPSNGEPWSITVINEGAGLPYNAAELVTLMLMSGATLEDGRSEAQRTAPPEATCYATVTSDQLNVRSYPASDSPVFDVLERDRRVIITGKLADSSWWRIDWPDTEKAAWVSAGYARTSCPLVEIPTVIRSAGPFSAENWYRDPFQVAVLRAEQSPEDCQDAPQPGLLLDPPATGRSRITLNGASFELDGTMFAYVTPNNELVLQVLEGPIPFQFEHDTVVEVPTGSQYRFPLNAAGTHIEGAPFIEPLDVTTTARLPLEHLPHPLDALPAPVREIPVSDDTSVQGKLAPGQPQTLVMDNRAGILHEITLTSNAFPVLRLVSTETDEVLQPFINQGNLSFSFWPTSDYPYLFELEAGSTASGTFELSTKTQDLRLCRPDGNSQSSTLGGGEDHAGSIWFGRAGERVTLTASGDISRTASSFPNWRLRIAAMFLETATLPPIEFDLIEGHNADEITWEVPETGYYWIEVWTQPSGTTTVSAACS